MACQVDVSHIDDATARFKTVFRDFVSRGSGTGRRSVLKGNTLRRDWLLSLGIHTDTSGP
jgi:hypothetical protein